MPSEVMNLTEAPSKLADLMTLAKVRLNALVVATTAGGYYMAAPGAIDPVAMMTACIGTALVAGGSAAINQIMERDLDQKMLRTRMRPMPDGRVSVAEAWTFAGALTAGGAALLFFGANTTAAVIALVTLLTYVVIYTPLKQKTSLATIVGAVPGALPPLIGWAAARGTLEGFAPWALFLVMFLWQLPHFLAIAWMYREDYARAGMPMLPVVDRDGALTGRQTVLWAATLIPFSLLPYLVGLATVAYAACAIVLGTGLLVLAFRFAFNRSNGHARALFYGTLTYLPLLWIFMALARQ